MLQGFIKIDLVTEEINSQTPKELRIDCSGKVVLYTKYPNKYPYVRVLISNFVIEKKENETNYIHHRR